MSDGLHEISATIGGLLEAARTSIRQRDADNVEARDHRELVRDELALIRASVANLGALEARVKAMEPDVEDWRRTKQRGIGVITAAGFVGGIIVYGLGVIAKKLGWTG